LEPKLRTLCLMSMSFKVTWVEWKT
jgi:hypothetical protein